MTAHLIYGAMLLCVGIFAGVWVWVECDKAPDSYEEDHWIKRPERGE